MLTSKTPTDPSNLNAVYEYWNRESCGEIYAIGEGIVEKYEEQRRSRYLLEPYLLDFARFDDANGKDVLEIGVGMGADHQSLAENNPKTLTGVDITERAIQHATERFTALNLVSNLRVANAENLPFADSSFDFVYSWGVIHHSPNTELAVKEIYRVLRKGGTARVMIYHRYSLVGFMLWVRYALLKGRLGMTLDEVYSRYLESPGTKAFTIKEAKDIFCDFEKSSIRAICSFGDLLEGSVGQRHRGALLALARLLWPRQIIKALSKGRNFGLCLLIEAKK